MEEKTATFELMEPRSPESLVPNPWVEPWMIIIAVILMLVALGAVWFFMRKKSVPVDPRALREAARAEAAAALDAIGEIPAREAAVVSSLVLRKYLSTAAGDPALFETHEETISRHEAFKSFSDEARSSASIGFSRLAAIKYSAVVPDMNREQVVTGSRNLLEILHHGFRA
jgi:hypothetical protein